MPARGMALAAWMIGITPMAEMIMAIIKASHSACPADAVIGRQQGEDAHADDAADYKGNAAPQPESTSQPYFACVSGFNFRH